MLQCLIQLLSSEFKLCDLGIVHYFLGIEVTPTGIGLMLRHHKYTLDILTQADMLSCKPVDTLISTSKATILSYPFFFWCYTLSSNYGCPLMSLLQGEIFALLLTESIGLCMLLQILIRLSLNASCVILRVRQHMAFILLVVLHFPYMALQMQIG